MDIQIVAASPDSLSDIVRLMRDFAAFEKLEQYCTVTEGDLEAAMFGERAFVKGLVARDGDVAVAYALFYMSFASFRGQRGYFLEDLYIDARYRRQGLGEAMLKAVGAAAKSDGAVRLDFLVLNWNTPALDFYTAHGAASADDELHLKFTDAAFDQLSG